MGMMFDLRDELGVSDISMRYDGPDEVYMFQGKEVRVPAGASKDEVKAAIKQAIVA